MAKKKRRLEQYVNTRRKNPEVVLAERAQLSNRIFRLFVGVALTILLAFLIRPPDVPQSAGLAIFLVVVTLLGGFCLHRLQPGAFERPSSFNKFVLLLCFEVGLCRFLQFMGWSPLLAPLALFAMVVTLAYSQTTALLAVFGLAFIHGLTSPRLDEMQLPVDATLSLPSLLRVDLPLVLVLTAGALTSSLGVRRVREQSKPVFVGLYAGVVQALMVLAMELMSRNFDPSCLSDPFQVRALLRDPGWAFLGGLVSGGMLTCLLPQVERFFDFVTERRLLELADPSNELLRVLRDRAPGTYQHTLQVAQLAGNAAEAIGGDRLLTEVGTFYHDIGKIEKPEYFVENMGEDKTIHDRLRPSMSKMIIVSHVKEGILLAKDEKLPRKIIDMIPMHHGTTVVEYFYQKARRAAEPEEGAPSETEFRYPGPKPRFREAGILMLSDMVEAIAKGEVDPNPSRFRAMVHDQILKRLLDGQLDESDLTLNDLRVIEDSFVKTLTTMYHHRIKYPGQGVPATPVPGAPSGRAQLGAPAHDAAHEKEAAPAVAPESSEALSAVAGPQRSSRSTPQ